MKKAEVVKQEEQMTRKEALKKVGKYAAFTAIGSMILLSPKKSQAQSNAPAHRGRGY